MCCLFPTAEWFDWGPWGACSSTCGKGIEERRRLCSSDGGCSGMGSDVELQYCHLGPQCHYKGTV